MLFLSYFFLKVFLYFYVFIFLFVIMGIIYIGDCEIGKIFFVFELVNFSSNNFVKVIFFFYNELKVLLWDDVMGRICVMDGREVIYDWILEIEVFFFIRCKIIYIDWVDIFGEIW